MDDTNITVHSFPVFTPGSAGNPVMLGDVVRRSVNALLPSLLDLSHRLGPRPIDIVEPYDFLPNSPSISSVLGEKLDYYGSDKASLHGYHRVYGKILGDPDSIESVLEIGLGTNNSDVLSSMGPSGKPGASLRAFRDSLPKAVIYGADIDKRILFTEDRIETFFVDQMEQLTFNDIRHDIKIAPNVVIDDGLHAPLPNLNTLNFALSILAPGGWVVIEDIPERSVIFWSFISTLFDSALYYTAIVKANLSYMFIVHHNVKTTGSGE